MINVIRSKNTTDRTRRWKQFGSTFIPVALLMNLPNIYELVRYPNRFVESLFYNSLFWGPLWFLALIIGPISCLFVPKTKRLWILGIIIGTLSPLVISGIVITIYLLQL